MLLSVVHILLRYVLCFTDTNICMYAYLKNDSVRPLVNRNNIVILHLIQIQRRLFLIGFTINIIQLEMIKETIVKPYRFTQGFYPSVSLFLYLNRKANQSNPVSFLLHIYLHFCSKKAAEQHFP